jgi:hypothetical protein
MWSSCNPSGESYGTDGHYVLAYHDGLWEPVMTVQEWERVSHHQRTTIAPLPTRPANAPIACPSPTTTTLTPAPSTSTSTTTSTSTSTTTTTVPAPAPSVGGLSPDSGWDTGGQSIQVYGSGLSGATAVYFGTTPAQSFTVQNDGMIYAVTPVLDAGSYEVTVVTPGGTAGSTSDLWDAFDGA